MTTPATVVTGVDFANPIFSAHVHDGVTRIDNLIESELTGGDQIIRAALLHLFEAGGKRFRPLFTVLSAQFGPDPDNCWRCLVRTAGDVRARHDRPELAEGSFDDDAKRRRVADAGCA